MKTISCIFALATAITASACTVDDQQVATSDYALDRGYGYELNLRNPTNSTFFGSTVNASDMRSCLHLNDGVVRGWRLNERNKFDFRYSRVHCRKLNSNGTQSSIADSNDHFFHAGGGTVGVSFAPSHRLPVAVRLRYKYFALGSPYKISDVAILHNDADSIYAGYTGYTAAPYALGRGGKTRTLTCPTGSVITGIGVKDKYFSSGGRNQAEILGVRIECSALDVVRLR